MHPASMVQPQSAIVPQYRVEGREQCHVGVNATENPAILPRTYPSLSLFSQESRGIRTYAYVRSGDRSRETPIDGLGRVIKRVGKTGNSNSREERPRHPSAVLPSSTVYFLPPSRRSLARSLPYKLISRGAPPCCRLARCRTIEFSLSIYLSVCINIYIYI